MLPDDRDQQFLQAERLLELKSADLKKELRLGDLVLSQVIYIVAPLFFGTAGKLGARAYHVLDSRGVST